jgi:hypothetical protein
VDGSHGLAGMPVDESRRFDRGARVRVKNEVGIGTIDGRMVQEMPIA